MRPGDETRGWRPGSEASGWRSSNDSNHLNSGNEASRPRYGNEASSQGAGIEASRQRSGNEASVGWGNQAVDWSPFTQPGPSWWCGGQGNQVQGFTPYRMTGYMPFPGPPLQGNHWGQPFFPQPSMPQGGCREVTSSLGQTQSWTSHPSGSGTGNEVRGCKRRRSAMSPSPSSASEEEVNPFLSEKERRELLSGEDSGSETNEDEDTELAEPQPRSLLQARRL